MTHETSKMQRSRNKRYGWLRRKFAAAMRERHAGKPLSAEHKAKLSEAAKRRKRRPHSAEAKAKMSAAAKGRKKSAEHIAAMVATKTGKKTGPRSESTKARISEALRSSAALKASRERISADPDYRARQSAAMKAVWAIRKQQKEAAAS